MKITITILMAFVCLNISALAQDKTNIAALKIGDQVPDITINNIINYKGADGKTATIVKISDFKGKLLILDFWATWCSPCVAMIPKMDSLQKMFGNQIQILPVTYQSQKEVQLFLKKLEDQKHRNFHLPDVVEEKKLNQLFPHTYLPHYVWINQSGIVKAITEPFYLTADNIAIFLRDGTIDAKIKQDAPITYDKKQPLFFTSNELSKHILKQSSWAGYIDGVGRSFHRDISPYNDSQLQRISVRNLTIPELFDCAYQKELKETVFEVADTTRLFLKTPIAADYMDWLRNGHSYCYELIVDKSLAENGAKFMQRDLADYFPEYKVTIEKRKVKCLTLVRTSNLDKIKSTGGTPTATFDRFGAKLTNCYLTVFIARMQYYLQSCPLPLADETGYLGKTDISLTSSLSNISELNSELKKYDLQFVEKDAFIDMLVIKDKN